MLKDRHIIYLQVKVLHDCMATTTLAQYFAVYPSVLATCKLASLHILYIPSYLLYLIPCWPRPCPDQTDGYRACDQSALDWCSLWFCNVFPARLQAFEESLQLSWKGLPSVEAVGLSRSFSKKLRTHATASRCLGQIAQATRYALECRLSGAVFQEHKYMTNYFSGLVFVSKSFCSLRWLLIATYFLRISQRGAVCIGYDE